MNGIVDVITLLLGLSGFGLAPNPKPATPDATLQYAIPDADVVLHFDAASVIPSNYRKLSALASQPQIKASPELSKAVRQAVTEIESARGLAKTMSGIDVTSDISDITAFFQIKRDEPDMVIAVHGHFSAANIEKISNTLHKPAVKLPNGSARVEVDDTKELAFAPDGVLLFGTRALIDARVQGGWKAPAHGSGTNLGYTAEMIAQHPVFALAVTLSQSSRDQAVADIGGQNVATDMIKRGRLATFALFHDGIGWSWIDSSKAGLDAMTDISNGAVDLLRAAQIAPRGVAKIVLGGLESYRGNRDVDQLLAHKADLVKLVDAYIGDGTFKAKVTADPKTLRLDVRLTGKSASDVVPFAALVPMGVLFMVGRSADESKPMIVAPPPLPATSGRKTTPAPAPAPKRK